jgi:hypothetical protein
MTEDQKQQLAILGLIGTVVYVVSRPKAVARYRQGTGTMTNVQLAEAYREIVDKPLRIYINPTDESDPETGTPWAVDLAAFTKNYAAVKAEYLKYYGSDMSQDLLKWFTPIELSQYVAALWDKQKQAMS